MITLSALPSLFAPPLSLSLSAKKQTQYGTIEKIRDVAFFIFHLINETIKNTFFRLFSAAAITYAAFSPHSFLSAFKGEYHVQQLTPENISKDQVFCEPLPTAMTTPSKEKLTYVLNRVESIAKQMGIKQKIEVYTSHKICPTAVLGGASSLTPVLMFLDVEMINSAEDEIDFVIGHELSHVKHNDIFINAALSNIALMINFLFLNFYPWGIVLNEAVFSIANCFICRKIEQIADVTSMQTLHSSYGAKKVWTKFIRKMLSIKQAKPEDIKNFVDPRLLPKLTPRKIARMQQKITPEGNNRLDFEHPPFTQRLLTAKTFHLS